MADTSPLPTTLEEYESLKLFWRGEGYAVGCVTEKALREALMAWQEFDSTPSDINNRWCIDLLTRARALTRTALSTSNDSGGR